MKTTLSILAFALAYISNAQTVVDYTIKYTPDIATKGLLVEMVYKTKKAQDSIYLHYYNDGWGESDLFNCLSIQSSDNPEMTIEQNRDSNRLIVHYPKSKRITFTYRIQQDYPGDSIDIFNRPKMSDTYFHILGRSLFVVPEDVFADNEQRIEAKIHWEGFPENYVIHNTFDSQEQSQTIKTSLHGGLYHSLFVGGDYRLYPFTDHKKEIVFAVRGNWLSDYSDDQKMLAALQRTVQTQREFWNDYERDYYTVIMSPTVTQNDSLFKGQSSTGSAVKNGFMLQSSNNPFNQFYVLNYMFNHEMMHEWIGLTIKNEHEELNYWFSEGFTDYYTYKNRVRSGDMSIEEWRESFNKDVLMAHYSNPERNRPNYIIVDDFWKNRNVEKIPYRRGAIFAFWLDNKIMKCSNYKLSLDDFMRELLVISKTKNLHLTDELFLTEVKKYIKDEDISYEFQKYILVGEDIPFTQSDLIDCFDVEFNKEVPQIVLKESAVKYIIKQ